MIGSGVVSARECVSIASNVISSCFANLLRSAHIPSEAVCFYKFMPIERLTSFFDTIGGISASLQLSVS